MKLGVFSLWNGHKATKLAPARLSGKYDPITMGGMFTLLKVRDRLAGYADPGWYDAPAGTLASPATAAELARDGFTVGAPAPKKG